MTNSKQAISKITNANFLPKSTKEALLKLIIAINTVIFLILTADSIFILVILHFPLYEQRASN